MKNNITALTIAGSDSGGGAGIQADLKTFSALGVYGTTAITVITAQNINKINDIFVLPDNIIRKQIEMIIKGYPIKVAKTGILYSKNIIDIIVQTFINRNIKLIIDPIMISTSGKHLIDKDSIKKMTSTLFPIANLITPNIPEAEYLTNSKINSIEDMQETVSILFDKYKVPFLLKGGHLDKNSDDVLITEEGINLFSSKRISGVNSHGSGCTLSAAITAFLCQDYSLYEAVKCAKEYIKSTLSDPIQISKNTQIINHFANY